MSCSYSFPFQKSSIDNMMNLNDKDSEMFPSPTFGNDDSTTPSHQKNTKKKSIIKYVDFTSNLKKGTNIAKFIIISFAAKIQLYKRLYGAEQKMFEQTYALLQNLLLKAKNSLNLSHLKELFGKVENSRTQIRNLLNCKVFKIILEQNVLDLVMANPKIEDKITYLNCALKYVGRLQNQLLSERIQSR